MANKKINELVSRVPSLTDLMLVGDPSSGYSYKCTVSALATVIETDISDGYVTLGTTQTITGAKSFTTGISAVGGIAFPATVGGSNYGAISANSSFFQIAAQNSSTILIQASSGTNALTINTAGKVDFGSTLGNGTYTYTLPSATGTLALTSNITSAISGTTGYITKFTGTNTVGNSIMFENAGKIGIGNNTPNNLFVISNSGAAGFEFDPATNNIYSFNRTTTAYSPMNFYASIFIWNIGETEKMRLETNGNFSLQTIPNATTDTDKFLVSDSGVIKYRTGSELLSDIGGASSASISGTTNYIPKFTSSSAIGNSNLQTDASGNLVLGVTPSSWEATDSRVLQLNGGSLWSFSTSQINLLQNSYFNSSGNLIYTNNGAASAYRQISGVHSWYNAPSGTAGNAITFTQAMTLDASGNLGVGTTVPGVRLHAEATNSNVAIINVIGTAPNYIFDVRDDGVSKFRVDPSGNVGIGTTSPNRTLTVNGLLGVTNGTANTQQFIFSIDGTAAYLTSSYIGSSSYVPMAFEVGGSERMRITSGGEVYIAGTTDQGAYNLQVNGTGVWGAGAYVNGSDSSLKENIQNMGSALELVNQLQPKTYTYKPTYSKDTTTQVGFIAQDLEQVLGNQIYKNSIVVDGPNFKSVAYQNLIPLLVQSIKELKAEIETLKNK